MKTTKPKKQRVRQFTKKDFKAMIKGNRDAQDKLMREIGSQNEKP